MVEGKLAWDTGGKISSAAVFSARGRRKKKIRRSIFVIDAMKLENFCAPGKIADAGGCSGLAGFLVTNSSR
jgi:hypothetical protein